MFASRFRRTPVSAKPDSAENRNDMPGVSTLGHLPNNQSSLVGTAEPWPIRAFSLRNIGLQYGGRSVWEML
jgi:hypothetical protein